MVKKWLGADRGLWWQWLILLNSVQHGWSGDFKRQCYCTFFSNLDLWIANTGNAFLLHTDSDTLLAHIWDRVALDSFCCWYLPPLLFSQNVNICSVCILIAGLGVLLHGRAVGTRMPQDPLLCAGISCLMTLAWQSCQSPLFCAPDEVAVMCLIERQYYFMPLNRKETQNYHMLYTHPTTGARVRVCNGRASYTAHLQVSY